LSTQKRAAEARPDLPFHDVIDYLIRKWRGPGTVYCAYEILKAVNQLGLQELQSKLAQLAEEQVLQPRWILEAPTGRLQIGDDELNAVLSRNEYQHPETGEIIVKAALKICLVYESGPALNQLMMFSGVAVDSTAA